MEASDRREGEAVGGDLGGLAEPAQRRRRDAERQREQKRGLRQRRHRLDLGVAERMALVGGLVGDAHGEIGRGRWRRCRRALCAPSEISASEPESGAGGELQQREAGAGRDREQRRAALARAFGFAASIGSPRSPAPL